LPADFILKLGPSAQNLIFGCCSICHRTRWWSSQHPLSL